MKAINNQYGHKVSDMALVDTAEVLRNRFCSADIMARIGENEFVVMVTETSETYINTLTFYL